MRKTPVLQLKQSNLPSALYLLNKQLVREKHVSTDSIIKSGQKDTEASISWRLMMNANSHFSTLSYSLLSLQSCLLMSLIN